MRQLLLKHETKTTASFCIVSSQIRKLSRWEVIHVVRTMSTEAAKSGEEGKKNYQCKEMKRCFTNCTPFLIGLSREIKQSFAEEQRSFAVATGE